MKHAILVEQFIEQIWNQQSFEKLPYFLHPDFKDYSLPPSLAADPEGTKKWILNTSHSFTHHSIIEAQVTEGESSMIKIKMELRHTGHWRGVEPTGLSLHTTGYRYFKFKDGKIIEHQALIDGESIEKALKTAAHGCAVQV